MTKAATVFNMAVYYRTGSPLPLSGRDLNDCMIAAVTVALTSLILIPPFAVGAVLSWAAHRSGSLRIHADQVSAPMSGQLYEDRDTFRVEHDLNAIRTRFEQNSVWPASGARGERR
jgi:hypothetical protein